MLMLVGGYGPIKAHMFDERMVYTRGIFAVYSVDDPSDMDGQLPTPVVSGLATWTDIGTVRRVSLRTADVHEICVEGATGTSYAQILDSAVSHLLAGLGIYDYCDTRYVMPIERLQKWVKEKHVRR